jgi:transcriptional regulator PpsR
MTDDIIARPDITLTVDRDGVIQTALSSESLAGEQLETWRGRPWRETIETGASGESARKMKDAAGRGASSCFQVSQIFPSGRQLPIEYTTVSLGERAGFVAIGKNLQTISDLQARLLLAQEAREQDYWKIREIETRYRLLFDAANEAVLLVRVANMRIVEANLAAMKALDVAPGAEFHPDLSTRDRKAIDAMLDKVREQGRAPGIVLHLGPANHPWSLRASLVKTESGSYYLFQIASVGALAPIAEAKDHFSAEQIIQRLPDGFAIIDRHGVICRTNHTLLDLLQIGAEQAVLGQNLKRWLSRPGADSSDLLGLLQKYGTVRSMAATLSGELGSSVEVEISGVADKDANPGYFGLVMRDVTMRMRAGGLSDTKAGPEDAVISQAEGATLEQLVRASTQAIEQRAIWAALQQSDGNRTLAAKRLGISRQSLHAKLNKYGVAADRGGKRR